MSASVVVVMGVSAGLGGFLGALAPTAWRALTQRLAAVRQAGFVNPTWPHSML